jgi:hypothetical protein
MRVMILMKANQRSEAGEMPGEQLLTEMGRFNEELAQAGVLLAGEGLHPSARGKRVRFQGDQRTVISGPFSALGETISGFWIWKVESMEEAVEWVKRIPNPDNIHEGEIEIRPIFEADDFGPELTPELRQKEERLRRELDAGANI